MIRLKNRQLSIPNGYRYYWPLTGFKARVGSFDSVTQQFQAHLRGNVSQANKAGIDPDNYEQVADLVDAFNAAYCRRMLYFAFITGVEEGQSSSVPFRQAPLQRRVENVAAGGDTLIDWIRSGAEAVPKTEATRRGAICSKCESNKKGDWLRFFTVPVSRAIQFALNRRDKMKLETEHDSKLGVCELCDCPLQLKIHLPMQRIVDGIDPDVRKKLPGNCWIEKT